MNHDPAGGHGLSVILDATLADRFRRHLVAALRGRGFRSLPPRQQPGPARDALLVRGHDLVTVEVRPDYSGAARITLRVAGPEGEALLAEAAAETAKELVLDVIRPLVFPPEGNRLSAEVEELLRAILAKLDVLRTMPQPGLSAPEI